ncbi:hypothetical protein KGY79_12930, partial [Candidatus Bipolaricaulota bacterium]|nr:hypothetical protein [Candidatus Bipolaricaulota bacterium]
MSKISSTAFSRAGTRYTNIIKPAAIIFIMTLLLVVPNPNLADEQEKVTVPINQVVKTSKLSAEQLAKSKVTVPRSWVDQDYLEEHFPQEGESKPQSSISNIPDGTYTQKPEV